MKRDKSEAEKRRARVNPAARDDRPGDPHEDLARSDRDPPRDPVKGYQDAELDPRDSGGIGS